SPPEGFLRGRHAVGPAVPAAEPSAAPPTTRPASAAPRPAWSTSAARARRPRVGDVHRDLPPVQLLAVELGDGTLASLRGRHVDEAEASGLSRELVGDHRGRLDGTAL